MYSLLLYKILSHTISTSDISLLLQSIYTLSFSTLPHWCHFPQSLPHQPLSFHIFLNYTYSPIHYQCFMGEMEKNDPPPGIQDRQDVIFGNILEIFDFHKKFGIFVVWDSSGSGLLLLFFFICVCTCQYL